MSKLKSYQEIKKEILSLEESKEKISRTFLDSYITDKYKKFASYDIVCNKRIVNKVRFYCIYLNGFGDVLYKFDEDNNFEFEDLKFDKNFVGLKENWMSVYFEIYIDLLIKKLIPFLRAV